MRGVVRWASRATGSRPSATTRRPVSAGPGATSATAWLRATSPAAPSPTSCSAGRPHHPAALGGGPPPALGARARALGGHQRGPAARARSRRRGGPHRPSRTARAPALGGDRPLRPGVPQAGRLTTVSTPPAELSAAALEFVTVRHLATLTTLRPD